MKRVYQQVVELDKSDCMRAAVASLLGEELENVPNFIEYGFKWGQVFDEYIRERGYKEKEFLYNPIMYGSDVLPDYSLDRIGEFDGVGGYFYASVSSPKYNPSGELDGITHAVIIDKDFNIVHDPNPEYNIDGLKYPRHDKYNGVRQVIVIEKIQ